MRRKPIVHRLRSIARLRSVLERTRRPLDRALRDRPAARVGLTYLPLLDHLHAELVTVERRLAGAEDAYFVAKAQAASLREERDRVADSLRQQHENVRRWLLSLYGDSLRAVVGPAPQSPPALARHARRAVAVLRDLAHRPVTPVLGGGRIDPALLAVDLERRVEPLDVVLAQLDVAAAGIVAAQEHAARAMGEARQVESSVVRCVEGLGGLVGMGGSVGKRRTRRG